MRKSTCLPTESLIYWYMYVSRLAQKKQLGAGNLSRGLCSHPVTCRLPCSNARVSSCIIITTPWHKYLLPIFTRRVTVAATRQQSHVAAIRYISSHRWMDGWSPVELGMTRWWFSYNVYPRLANMMPPWHSDNNRVNKKLIHHVFRERACSSIRNKMEIFTVTSVSLYFETSQ